MPSGVDPLAVFFDKNFRAVAFVGFGFAVHFHIQIVSYIKNNDITVSLNFGFGKSQPRQFAARFLKALGTGDDSCAVAETALRPGVLSDADKVRRQAFFQRRFVAVKEISPDLLAKFQ